MRLVRVALLALLDEEGVLHHARGIEEEPDAVLAAERAQGLHVRHAHRLAARHVHGAGQADVGDLAGAALGDQRSSLPRSTLPLKGCRSAGSWASSMITSTKMPPGQFLVQARGREVHVARHVLALADRRLADQVLGAASLVRRHDVLVAVVRSGSPLRGDRSCGCRRRPRRPASCRPTAGRSSRWCRCR